MGNDRNKPGNLEFSASTRYTDLVNLGRAPHQHHGFINIPVYHGSTVLFPTAKAFIEYKQEFTYTRAGTPTSRNFEKSVAKLEGGFDTILCPSGLNAITTSLLAFLKCGDHLLMVDSVYQPTRRFCEMFLRNLDIETTYYDPLIGSDIERLIKPNTKVIFTESPGSQTMEVQDLPAISDIAHQHEIVVITDNTWATSVYYDVLKLGVDVSVQAVTKYIGGHADLMMGVATAGCEKHFAALKSTHKLQGLYVSGDDINLAARGLRTLRLRLERHMENGIAVAEWLQARAEVEEVFHPALARSPGHDIWKRDFDGAGSLFSVRLKSYDDDAVFAMLDNLQHFGIGESWGGFESLVLPFNPSTYRTVSVWPHKGYCLRFFIGLENPEDLIADLETGFEVLNAFEASTSLPL